MTEVKGKNKEFVLELQTVSTVLRGGKSKTANPMD